MPLRPTPHFSIGQVRPSRVEPRPRHVEHLTYETVERGELKSRHRWQLISPPINVSLRATITLVINVS